MSDTGGWSIHGQAAECLASRQWRLTFPRLSNRQCPFLAPRELATFQGFITLRNYTYKRRELDAGAHEASRFVTRASSTSASASAGGIILKATVQAKFCGISNPSIAFEIFNAVPYESDHADCMLGAETFHGVDVQKGGSVTGGKMATIESNLPGLEVQLDVGQER